MRGRGRGRGRGDHEDVDGEALRGSQRPHPNPKGQTVDVLSDDHERLTNY